MLLSWIDPDEVRALVAKLEGPKQAPPQPAWELHTLPATTVKAMPVQEHLLAPPPAKPPLEPELDLPLSDNRPGPASSHIWNIREQLRSLRQQAEGSGILPTIERPAPQPVPEDETEVLAEAPPLTVEQDAFYAAAPVAETIAPATTETMDEPPPPAPSRFSDTARSVMEHMLEASGPQPEEPPTFDIASLPQPMSPPTADSPLNIEYIGPAPTSSATEPLFSAPDKPVLVTPPPAPSTAPLVAPVEALPTEEAHPFVVPDAGLSERIDALARWACMRLATEEVLLVDDFGDVLWGGRAQTALVLSAMMAWHSAQRSSAESATHDNERIEKELSAGRWLTVLPARTRYGTVSLAAIRSSKLSDNDVRIVRAALLQAVEGKD